MKVDPDGVTTRDRSFACTSFRSCDADEMLDHLGHSVKAFHFPEGDSWVQSLTVVGMGSGKRVGPLLVALQVLYWI